MLFRGSRCPSWLQNLRSWGSEGHLGSKLGDLGVILAARLRTLGQLGHLKKQLGHFSGHLAPKVGHKTPFRGSECDPPARREWDLDLETGGRGGVFGTWRVSIGEWQTAKCLSGISWARSRHAERLSCIEGNVSLGDQ